MMRCLILPLTLLLATGPAMAESGHLRPGRTALIEPAAPWLIDVAADIGFSTRAFVAGPDVLRVDTTRILVNAGIHLLPWLHAQAGAGWMESEVGHHRGEGGFAWQAGLHLSLIEQVIAASPVAGVKQAMGLTLETHYRHASSNRGQDDFNWHEWAVTPLFHYTVTRADNPLWHVRQPEATALQLGVQVSTIDGKLGAQSVRENRNFAGVAGVQVLLANQWSTQARAVLHGSGDRAFELRLGRYF